MAVRYFDLAHLFEQAFGYRSQAFDPEFTPVQGNTPTTRIATGAYGSPYYASDSLNREYFMPVTLEYQDNGRTTEWNLPNPVISISSKKNIVATPLTGRTGTVRGVATIFFFELIVIDDYVIVIKGLIIGQGNEFPEQQTAQLRSLYESAGPVALVP